jgi:hypothetical protein
MTIRCLIIDGDPVFSQKIKRVVQSFRDDFYVHTVAAADEAIAIITTIDIALIFCEVSLFLEQKFISCVVDKKPAVPLLLIDGNTTLPDANTILSMGIIKGSITRDVRQADLAGKVVVALDKLFYQGNVQNVNCCTLIQLLEKNCSDCMLKVTHSEKHTEGMLFLRKGILIDAVCGESEALQAVKRILSWPSTIITFYSICPLTTDRINESAAILILKGLQDQKPEARATLLKEMETSVKNAGKSANGLAGLFLGKVKGNR